MSQSELLEKWADAEADDIEERDEDTYYLNDCTNEKAGKIAERIYHRNLRSIWRLVLEDNDITDDAVTLISKLGWLQYLGLLGNKVTNNGIQEIANGLKELRGLDICSNEEVTDIRSLFSLKNLEKLFASHTNVKLTSDDVVEYIEKSQLKIITLDGSQVTSDVLQQIETVLENRKDLEHTDKIGGPEEDKQRT